MSKLWSSKCRFQLCCTPEITTGHLEMLQTFSTSAACHTKSCAFVRDGRLWLQNLLRTLWTSNTSCIAIRLNTTAAILYHFHVYTKNCFELPSNRFQIDVSSVDRTSASESEWCRSLAVRNRPDCDISDPPSAEPMACTSISSRYSWAHPTLWSILDAPSTICHLPCWLLERSLATNPTRYFNLVSNVFHVISFTYKNSQRRPL